MQERRRGLSVRSDRLTRRLDTVTSHDQSVTIPSPLYDDLKWEMMKARVARALRNSGEYICPYTSLSSIGVSYVFTCLRLWMRRAINTLIRRRMRIAQVLGKHVPPRIRNRASHR